MPILVPFLLLTALTAVFSCTSLDIGICRLFYDGQRELWSQEDAWLWRIIYRWGPVPGLVLGIGGLAAGLGGIGIRPLQRYREAGFFLAALLALGPGLLVNSLFKPHWCRPRPHETTCFGGTEPFVGVWGFDSQVSGRSFPSGHASMGFYLMAPAFLLYGSRRRLAWGFILLGVLGGTFVGLARIAQGDHFPSDIVWSAGMVYLGGLALVVPFRLARRRGNQQRAEVVERSEGGRIVAAPTLDGLPPHRAAVRPGTAAAQSQEARSRRDAA